MEKKKKKIQNHVTILVTNSPGAHLEKGPGDKGVSRTRLEHSWIKQLEKTTLKSLWPSKTLTSGFDTSLRVVMRWGRFLIGTKGSVQLPQKFSFMTEGKKINRMSTKKKKKSQSAEIPDAIFSAYRWWRSLSNRVLRSYTWPNTPNLMGLKTKTKNTPFLTKSNAGIWSEHRQTKRSTNKQGEKQSRAEGTLTLHLKRVCTPRFAAVFNMDLFIKAEIQLDSTSRLDKFCSCVQMKDDTMPSLEILVFFPLKFQSSKIFHASFRNMRFWFVLLRLC